MKLDFFSTHNAFKQFCLNEVGVKIMTVCSYIVNIFMLIPK